MVIKLAYQNKLGITKVEKQFEKKGFKKINYFRLNTTLCRSSLFCFYKEKKIRKNNLYDLFINQLFYHKYYCNFLLCLNLKSINSIMLLHYLHDNNNNKSYIII